MARGASVVSGLGLLALVGVSASCSGGRGCSGRRGQTEATIVKDEAPDARHDEAPLPVVPDRMLADARVVDLRRMDLACALSPDLPLKEVTDGRRAYLLGKDLVLRAYDFGCTAGELWHATVKAACDDLVVSRDHVFCGTSTTLTHFSTVPNRPAGSDVTAEGKTLSLATASPMTQVLVIDDKLMVFHESKAIEVFEAEALLPFYAVTLPMGPGRYQPFVLTRKPRGACGVQPSGRDHHLLCIDAFGKVRLSQAIAISKPSDPWSTSFHLRQLDERYALISSLYSGTLPKRAVVVRLSDGAEMARIEDEIAAVVTRAEDGSIEGLLATLPQLRLLETSGAERWKTVLPYPEDSAAAIAQGNRIYVVDYPLISSGARPLAFDRTTGKLLWTGDFDTMMVAHSAYTNLVTIGLHATDDGEVLAVRGRESMVTYLQLFDLRDGRRRYSQTRYTY